MKTMIELLRDADPLLHEARTTMDQRDSRRKALLAAASIPHDRAGANPRSRATLLVGVRLPRAPRLREHPGSSRRHDSNNTAIRGGRARRTGVREVGSI